MRRPLWFAFLLHRLSGLALVLFLPAHFYLLSLAMRDADRLQSFFDLTDAPLLKVMEMGLVFLLAVHMFGGLRLMALELLGWTNGQKTLAAGAAAISFALALLFLLRAL